ncbi:MAG: hypothetical protein GXO63_01125, partial [Candidatus Micrarchaeota archaeon]|nr:hypothetical protein [Candidatus Micrarchaeota archaeon]
MVKGMSPVVVVILLVVIVFVLISILNFWASGLIGKVSFEGERRIKTIEESLYCVKVESFSGNKIYLRNCGVGDITQNVLAVFIDDTPVKFVLKNEIESGKRGYIIIPELYRFDVGKHELTISAGSSIIKSYVELTYPDSVILSYSFSENWTLIGTNQQGPLGTVFKYFIYDEVGG